MMSRKDSVLLFIAERLRTNTEKESTRMGNCLKIFKKIFFKIYWTKYLKAKIPK